MSSFIKIKSSEIKEGMRFSAPVFFDDGKNMFLAEGKAAKKYHITALKRWAIPYLLTYGHLLSESSDAVAADEQYADDLEPLDDVESPGEQNDSEEDVTSIFLNEKAHIA